jgi:Uma2 family endonuclease
VREESPTVSAVAHYSTLPDSPYILWERGELARYLHLPDDGSRCEVIGGEISVSPGPTLNHNLIVSEIHRAFNRAEVADPSFRWIPVQSTDLNLVRIGDGYIPDLLLMTHEVAAEVRQAHARYLEPHQVELVVEVTSRSNAANDREPTPLRPGASKWSGYARTAIPFYLLVDRSPRIARTTLYTEPDIHAGTYKALSTWEFGETIKLPEPFAVEIPTGDWEPWED